MRDNHKGRKSRRLSHSQNKVVNEEQKVVSSLLNANSVVGAGYFPFCNQEENRSLSQKEDTSRILTRRSKARASNQTSEKSSGKKQLSETGVGNQIRKRKAMEGRSLDMVCSMQTLERGLACPTLSSTSDPLPHCTCAGGQ